MMFSDAIGMFEKYLVSTDKSSETVRGYTVDLNEFNRYLIKKDNAPPYLEDIDETIIEEYLFYLKDSKNLKPSSRSRKLHTLRSFWNFAYKKRLCERNVALSVEPVKVKQTERTFLSDEEMEKLIEAITHPTIRIVVQTLYYTGMRVGECTNLSIGQVDFARRVITVINGKGGKDRNIPMSDKLESILRRYLNEIREDESSRYFFALKKTGRVSAQYVNREIHDAVDRLKWNKTVTAHTLRHSFASNLIKKGVSIVHVQKLLGHSNLKVTSIYTHASQEDLSESINIL